jgi:hypothetical protein
MPCCGRMVSCLLHRTTNAVAEMTCGLTAAHDRPASMSLRCAAEWPLDHATAVMGGVQLALPVFMAWSWTLHMATTYTPHLACTARADACIHVPSCLTTQPCTMSQQGRPTSTRHAHCGCCMASNATSRAYQHQTGQGMLHYATNTRHTVSTCVP